MSEQTDATPPIEVSEEASEDELHLARSQGDAYGRAVGCMRTKVANDGGEKRSGDYLIGYTVEKAAGM